MLWMLSPLQFGRPKLRMLLWLSKPEIPERMLSVVDCIHLCFLTVWHTTRTLDAVPVHNAQESPQHQLMFLVPDFQNYMTILLSVGSFLECLAHTVEIHMKIIQLNNYVILQNQVLGDLSQRKHTSDLNPCYLYTANLWNHPPSALFTPTAPTEPSSELLAQTMSWEFKMEAHTRGTAMWPSAAILCAVASCLQQPCGVLVTPVTPPLRKGGHLQGVQREHRARLFLPYAVCLLFFSLKIKSDTQKPFTCMGIMTQETKASNIYIKKI